MKISLEWLREYVDVPESAAKLKEDLTMIGLLVESISEAEGGPVLEIEITSNRPDCLSYIGIAREISLLYGRELRKPAVPESLQVSEERVPYSVEILDTELCPRYTGLVLDSVRVAPSPGWMQRRLLAGGMRPVNNIVDITNYVLMEMGHPLHAFDFDRLRKGRILVDRARQGERFVTLDGIERELDSEMLMINDGDGPVALAGVMGGGNSEIADITTRVLLECAYFRPRSIRRTARKLGLSTEASYRFERGADWEGTIPSIARTCQLISEIAGGRIAGSLQDVYPKSIPPICLELSRTRAEKLLGIRLTDRFIESTLRKLGFALEAESEGIWNVSCPTFRADMELEADLIEELARFYGYENIPTTIPPSWSAGIPSPVSAYQSSARSLLLGLGYSEAVNLSFAGDSDHVDFPPFEAWERSAVRNPLTEDTRYLRTSLIPGLVKSARRNINHGMRDVCLFEIGKTYRNGKDGLPVERNTLGVLGCGSTFGVNWLHAPGDYGYFQLKGSLESLLTGMRCAPFSVQPAAEVAWLNPADASALFVQGRRAGVFGSLHPEMAGELKFKQPIFLAEIDFEELCRHVFMPVCYESLPKYPPVERDLSIMVPRSVTYGEVREGIWQLGIEELQSVSLIDVYEGEKIQAGKLSLTLRLVFLDRQRTLIVDRVQAFSDNVLAFLHSTYGAELR
jgi:phenylalanyl-tRNA synthetase beta chain